MRIPERFRPYVAVLLIVGLAEIYFFWNILRYGFATTTVATQYDASLFIWANGWVAHALATFQNPFFSHAVLPPHGYNLLSNACNVGMDILFAPVTWIWGPIAALNAQMMCILLANAIAMTLCVRAWVGRPWIAVAAGVMWGLCPFMVGLLGSGWTNWAAQWTLPLGVFMITRTFRDKAWSLTRAGVYLSLLTIAQFFICQEGFLDNSVGIAVFGLVFLMQQRRSIFGVMRGWVRGSVAFVAPLAVVVGPAIYFARDGPSHFAQVNMYAPIFYYQKVVGIKDVLFNSYSWIDALFLNVPGYQYLGIGIPLACIAGFWFVRRHPLAMPSLVLALAGIWICRGIKFPLSPDGFLHSFADLKNLIWTRLFLWVWFGCVLLLAIIGEHAEQWITARIDPRDALVRRVATPLLALLVLASPLVADACALPYWEVPAPVDHALNDVLALPGHHVVMTYPSPDNGRGMVIQSMRGGFTYTLSNSYAPQYWLGTRRMEIAEDLLIQLSNDFLWYGPTEANLQSIAVGMRAWGVTDIIVPQVTVYGDMAKYSWPREFPAAMVELLGTPQVIKGEWVWEHVHLPKNVTYPLLTKQQWRKCTRQVLTPLTTTCAANYLASNS